MATPVWDQLHVRFASGCRDAVTTAATNGLDLLVADRDNYLNAAYQKYILLAAQSYENDPEKFKILFQSIVKAATPLTAIAGVITLSSVTDYGFFLSLNSTTGGISVTRKSQEDFYRILRGTSGEIQATAYSKFCLPSNTQILIAPATDTDSYDLSYIILPATIAEGGATDIPLTAIHFDVILDFALWYFYKDKQEFDIAQSYLKDGYLTSPFKLKMEPVQ